MEGTYTNLKTLWLLATPRKNKRELIMQLRELHQKPSLNQRGDSFLTLETEEEPVFLGDPRINIARS